MLVFYFMIIGALFLGLGVFGSLLNGDRDFDKGFIIFGAPSALMGALVTSVATGNEFPVLVTAVIAVIGGAACGWGHYGNKLYAPPSWEEVGEVEADPLEEFRAQLAKAVARIAELENDKRALLSAAQHQKRQVEDLHERVAALEAKAETPKPAELLEEAKELTSFFVQISHPEDLPDPGWRPEAHA
jgi:hypothetical protein